MEMHCNRRSAGHDLGRATHPARQVGLGEPGRGTQRHAASAALIPPPLQCSARPDREQRLPLGPVGLREPDRQRLPHRHLQRHALHPREHGWCRVDRAEERQRSPPALRHPISLSCSPPRCLERQRGPSAERASRFLTAHRPAGDRREFPPARSPALGLTSSLRRSRDYVVVAKIPLTQLIAPGFDGVPVSSGTTVKELNLIAGLS